MIVELEEKTTSPSAEIALDDKKKRKKIEPIKAKSASLKGLKASGLTVGDNIQNLLKTVTEIKTKTKKVKGPKVLALSIDKAKQTIGLPANLESVSSDLWIQRMLQIYVKLGVNLTATPGKYTVVPQSVDDDFWNGFFDELVSTKKIEKVQYDKKSDYLNGRSVCRYELIKSLVPSDNQAWIRHIHQEFVGRKNVLPLLNRFVAKRFQDVKEQNDAISFLKDLVDIVVITPEYGVQKVVLKPFFDTFEELLSLCKRKKKTLVKGRGKTKEKVSTVNATKPSALKTVLPFERNAVQEIWEGPWARLENLKKQYIITPPQDVDRSKLLKELRSVVTKQWAAKTAVLKQTKHRVVRAKANSRLQEDLAETAKAVASIKNEDLYSEYITQKERTIAIFPVGNYATGEKVYSSFYYYLKEEKTADYPHARAILALHESCGVIKSLEKTNLGDRGNKRRKADEQPKVSNRFEGLSGTD